MALRRHKWGAKVEMTTYKDRNACAANPLKPPPLHSAVCPRVTIYGSRDQELKVRVALLTDVPSGPFEEFGLPIPITLRSMGLESCFLEEEPIHQDPA
jgi:hypothetical protein